MREIYIYTLYTYTYICLYIHTHIHIHIIYICITYICVYKLYYIYTTLEQKKKKTPSQIKMSKHLSKHFSEEYMQMANWYSKSLIIRHIQMKIKMNYHLLKWLLSKRQQIMSVGGNME